MREKNGRKERKGEGGRKARMEGGRERIFKWKWLICTKENKEKLWSLNMMGCPIGKRLLWKAELELEPMSTCA
jgi:hypothetical protein